MPNSGSFWSHYLPGYDRPDVAEAFQDDKGLRSGFSCNLAKGLVKSTDIVMVKVINDKNIEHVLQVDTLGSLLKYPDTSRYTI